MSRYPGRKVHFVTVGNPETLRQGEFTRWLVEDAVVRRIEDIVVSERDLFVLGTTRIVDCARMCSAMAIFEIE